MCFFLFLFNKEFQFNVKINVFTSFFFIPPGTAGSVKAEAARTVKLSRRSVIVVADGNSKSFNAVNEVCFVLFFKRNIIQLLCNSKNCPTKKWNKICAVTSQHCHNLKKGLVTLKNAVVLFTIPHFLITSFKIFTF